MDSCDSHASLYMRKGSESVELHIHRSQCCAPHALIVHRCGSGMKRDRAFVVGLPTLSMPFCDTLSRKFYEEQCLEGFWACGDVRTEAESQVSTWRAADQSHVTNTLPTGMCSNAQSKSTRPVGALREQDHVEYGQDFQDSQSHAYASSQKVDEVTDTLDGQQKGKTKMENLARFFHLPINNAGKQLGICPTVLKKICRKHGLQRWPHRKLRSIDRLLNKLQSTAEEANLPSTMCLHAEDLVTRIEILKRERAELCFRHDDATDV